jgi:hypothetical protein
MLQVDALAYSDLRRAIERGYCPTIQRLLDEQGFDLRRWFCGLPSATAVLSSGHLPWLRTVASRHFGFTTSRRGVS